MKKILLHLTLLFGAFSAFAGEDGMLSLSPAVVMLSGDFGQSTTQTIRLTNTTSRPFEFDLVAQDVIARDGKRVFVEAGALPGSIAATAVFSQSHVQVPPGESVSVNMTVTLPPDTPHRAVVALFRGTNKVMSGNTPMTASLGSLMTFSISDALEMSAAPLSVEPQSAASNLRVKHDCTNSGREPLVAKGMLAVVDGMGTLVGRAQFEPRRLLPGESTSLGGEYAGELEPGHYRVLVTYDYEGRTLTRSTEIDIP
jgi:hypothetical protein